jgi:malonate-semialdehyde dehydrogenase (acetylating)/methylmalonate-semialdehyde dehydrogenase
MRQIDHFIGGASCASGERHGDVFDPNNGGVQARVGLGNAADLARAMDIARARSLPGPRPTRSAAPA